MIKSDRAKALRCAISAAQTAGALMRANFRRPKKINESSQHDIKLELDVRCQKVIEKALLKSFPSFSILGEEGIVGDQRSEFRWVVDPIDGTVNFTYGIPHTCVSIALQQRIDGNGGALGTARPTMASGGSRVGRRSIGDAESAKSAAPSPDPRYQTIAGVVYDPFCNELWTGTIGEPARLNGRIIHVSKRAKLEEAIVSLGFAKYSSTLQTMLPLFNLLIHRVRKIRLMGAAALSMVYVASGRFDAYTETGVRLWDIAAGGLIIECAGGEFFRERVEGQHTYRIIANNGRMRTAIEQLG